TVCWSSLAGHSIGEPSSVSTVGIGLYSTPHDNQRPAAAKVAWSQQESGAGVAGVGEEERLATHLLARDGALALGRHQPVDEGLAPLLLDAGMLGRVHQHHAVLVEQPLVALHDD